MIVTTAKEPRYLIRTIGLCLILIAICILAVAQYFSLIQGEKTPRFVFLIIGIIIALICYANRRYRNSFMSVYEDKVIIQTIQHNSPVTLFYTNIQTINGQVGTYIDLPLADLDTSNQLNITLTNGNELQFTVSCTRKSFQKVYQQLLTHRSDNNKQ